MKRVLSVMMAMSIPYWAAAEVPDVNDFRIVPQFPDPAEGASLVLGANRGNGALALWDGDQVYLQDFRLTVEPLFEALASGYLGDPSFFDIRPDNLTAVFGSGVDGVVYEMSLNNPSDFEAGSEILVPTHATGVLLSGTRLLLDRTNDGETGAELVVVDLTTGRGVDTDSQVVIEKPAGSGTASLVVNNARTILYAMDSTTRELRMFTVANIISAFNDAETLDWEDDGILIGTVGQFLNGGPAGINRDGELVLGGSTGAPDSGGVQFVDPTAPASIVGTIDPAGSGPPFVVIFNSRLDEVVAIDPTFAVPFVYATEDAIPPIPPESPCATADEIDAAFEEFFEMIANEEEDIDDDGIRDSAMIALIELISCRGINNPLVLSGDTAFDTNLDVFATELSFAALSEFNQVIALLMMMSQSMQDAVLELLADNDTPLFGVYSILTCTDLENCLPEFVEDPNPDLGRSNGSRGVVMFEPYSAEGDPDDDGFTNLEEFINVILMGGVDSDFAIAASSRQLNGGPEIRGGSGGGGGCFIATAAYGTPLASEIYALRDMRDRALLPTGIGTAFVDTYYRLSPAIADRIAEDSMLRAGVRTLLQPAIWVARPHHADTLWRLALMIGVALVTCAGFHRRRRGRDG